MSAEIIPFDFEEQAVRVVMRDGEPWFVAADVCRILGLENVTRSIDRLDDDERMTLHITDALAGMTLHAGEGQAGRGGARFLNIISESGLYALIFTSR
jgi:prophage antirepressor-like protein